MCGKTYKLAVNGNDLETLCGEDGDELVEELRDAVSQFLSPCAICDLLKASALSLSYDGREVVEAKIEDLADEVVRIIYAGIDHHFANRGNSSCRSARMN